MPSTESQPSPRIPTTPHLLPQIEFLPDPRHTRSDSESDQENGDIYRGEPPTPPRTPRPESLSSSGSSSSSSSSSVVFGGRLGAVSAIVEHAITHWARAWASSSSLATSASSSSSSSSSSNSITTKSRTRRRHRRSLADLHNARSEREIFARIRAREEARLAPREFVLYTPPSLSSAPQPSRLNPARSEKHPLEKDGVLRTSDIDLITTKLSSALKDNFKVRRAHDPLRVTAARSKSSDTPESLTIASLLHHDYMMPEDLLRRNASNPPERIGRKARKGKQKAGKTERSASAPARVPTERELDRAWWLDVSSPTWEDMRAIGKVLHLHPLTLEDILQQDPREKLELFPKLGYYFISFRAIESRKTREAYHLRTTGSEEQDRILDQGIVSEVNVYLIVFREGICSFHFADISEHTDAVRNRVLMLDETVTMSSDWIAHGLMDSIVDSFFPYLDEIDKEVTEIEALVYSNGAVTSSTASQDPISPTPSNLSSGSDTVMGLSEKSLSGMSGENEKAQDRNDLSVTKKEIQQRRDGDIGRGSGERREIGKEDSVLHSPATMTHFSLHPSTTPRRVSFAIIVSDWVGVLRALLQSQVNARKLGPTMTTGNVHRMARARRLVTSLTRFLHTKSEVVAQIKKRLLKTGEFGLGNGTGDDQDVFMYMGDIQDHILALQQSLAHYERLLGQSHPAYLTQLRFSVSSAKSGSDKAVVQLTTISLGVLCVQTLIGLFSMNVNIPANVRDPTGKHNVFGSIVAGAVFIVCGYSCVVWWWWSLAKRRRGRLIKA